MPKFLFRPFWSIIKNSKQKCISILFLNCNFLKTDWPWVFQSFWSTFYRKITLYYLQVDIWNLVHYSTPLSVHYLLNTTHCTLHTVHYIVCATFCTLHSLHFILYSTCCTQYIVNYTLYTTYCTLHTGLNILYTTTVVYILYTKYCTLHTVY